MIKPVHAMKVRMNGKMVRQDRPLIMITECPYEFE
jgi:hypothetical protein